MQSVSKGSFIKISSAQTNVYLKTNKKYLKYGKKRFKHFFSEDLVAKDFFFCYLNNYFKNDLF